MGSINNRLDIENGAQDRNGSAILPHHSLTNIYLLEKIESSSWFIRRFAKG
jgi:hypothetical protein